MAVDSPGGREHHEDVVEHAEKLSREMETAESQGELLEKYGDKLMSTMGHLDELYVTGGPATKEAVAEAAQIILGTLKKYDLAPSDEEAASFQETTESLIGQMEGTETGVDREAFQEMLVGMDYAEMKDFLGSIEALELSEQQLYRIEQLSMMQTLLDELSMEFTKQGKTWTMWAARFFTDEQAEMGAATALTDAADHIINESVKKIVTDPNASIADAAPKIVAFFANPPGLVSSLMNPVNFGEVDGIQGQNQIKAETIAALRSMEHYSAADALAVQVLGKEFDVQAKKIEEEERNDIRNKTAMEFYTEPRYSEMKAEATRLGVGRKATAFIEDAIKVETEHRITIAGARFIERASLPPEKRAVWDQYNDMWDPQSEYFNMADVNRDFIVEQLCINIPILLASAVTGVGAGVLAARAAGSTAIAGRVAGMSSSTISYIKSSATLVKYLPKALQGVEAVAVVGSAFEVGMGVTGAAAAGALFDQGVITLREEAEFSEILSRPPSWMCGFMIGMATAGVFGQASKALIGIAPQAIRAMTSRISSPAAAQLAKELFARDQIEAGVAFMWSLFEHGEYDGDLEDFKEDIGDPLYALNGGIGTSPSH